MTRTLTALFIAAGFVTLTGVGSAALPGPSAAASASPSGAPVSGTPVTVAHTHRKASRCYEYQEGEKRTCRAKRADASAAAQVTFKPEQGDARSVQVPDGMGPQSTTLTLPPGRYLVTWEDQSEPVVVGADAFEISLKTQSGECRKAANACELDANYAERRLLVPAAQRAN